MVQMVVGVYGADMLWHKGRVTRGWGVGGSDFRVMGSGLIPSLSPSFRV